MNDRSIDMDYLLFAWQDESPDTAYYLDVEAGYVELVQRDLIDRDDLTDMIERDPERYRYVPKPAPDELRRDLQEFISTVTDEKLSRLLNVAWEAPDPLFACKSILSKDAGELSRWEKFRVERVRKRVEEWLAANFIS